LAAAGVLGGVGFAKNSGSVTQAQYGKTTICHKTHSKKNPFVTITVSPSAVPAHEKHGDTIGACETTKKKTTSNSTTPTTTTTTTTAATAEVASSPGKSGEKGKSGDNGKGNGKGPKK
jgi:hypothetical protein